jgi:release factor family 3
MDLFLHSDLELLLGPHEGPCISMYMPTDRSGPSTEQNPVRVKRLLRQAQDRIHALLTDEAQSRRFLRPLRRLLLDPGLFRHPGDGLAVFCSLDYCRTFHLPLAFPERLVVGEHFFVKPLLPLARGEETFYVLALSKNQVRLLECRGRSARRLAPPGLPHSLTEALGEKRVTPPMSVHSSSPAAGGRKEGYRRRVEEDEKAELVRYFRRVDAALAELFTGRRDPLVLAGVEYLLPLYREVNRYPHLLPEGIRGNPDEISDAELEASAWPLIEPHLLAGQRQAALRFAELAGTGRASNDVAEVLAAASQGRIDVLFLAGDADLWGRFDRGQVQVHEAPEPGDSELLDAAAALTLTQGGTAYAVRHAQVPGGGALAAVFRY